MILCFMMEIFAHERNCNMIISFKVPGHALTANKILVKISYKILSSLTLYRSTERKPNKIEKQNIICK